MERQNVQRSQLSTSHRGWYIDSEINGKMHMYFKQKNFKGDNTNQYILAFMPFGFGARKYPEASFVQQEAISFIARLVSKYYTAPTDNTCPKKIGILTLR